MQGFTRPFTKVLLFESVVKGNLYLAAAYAVYAQAILAYELEQERVGIGFDGVVYVPVSVAGY